jgi:hypothetical protein
VLQKLQDMVMALPEFSFSSNFDYKNMKN